MKNINFSLFEAAGGAAGGGGGGAAAVVAAGGAAAGAGGAAAAAGGGSPWHADLFKPDGSFNSEAVSKVPEAHRSLFDGELKNIKTVDDFFGKLRGLTGLAGRKALAPLPANATPEEIAAHQATIRTALGVPEKAEGYGLQRPQDFPQELWNDNRAKAAMEIMHKHNVSPAAAKALLEFQLNGWKEDFAAQQEYEKQFFAEQDKAFRTRLAEKGLDFDKTGELINRVALQFGLKADSPLLKNADVRMLLAEVGSKIGEAKFVDGKKGDIDTRSAEAIAKDIVSNKENPKYKAYWDPSHKDNAAVKREVEQLYAEAAKQSAAGGAR